MAYEIVSSQRTDGTDVAQWGEMIVTSRHGAVCALARRMVAAGAVDQRVEVRGLDGELHWTAGSLKWLAGRTNSENENHGPRWGVYKPRDVPFPDRAQ